MKNRHLNDSPFFRFMSFAGDVFLLHLCWLLGCVLVITAGASTTAAFSVAGKMAAKQDYRVFHDYWRAFRRDFGQATRLWVLFALLGLLILADYQLGLANSGALGGVLIAVAAAAALLWLCAVGGSFALLGRFVYTRSRDLLKDGLRISLARPKAALIWVAGMALLPLLYGPVPHLFWYLFPLWLLIGGGLTITAAAFALRPAFAQLEQQH